MRGQITSMSNLLHSIADQLTGNSTSAPLAPTDSDLRHPLLVSQPVSQPVSPPPPRDSNPSSCVQERVPPQLPASHQLPKARHNSTGQFNQPYSSQTWLSQGRRHDHGRPADPMGALPSQLHYRDGLSQPYDSDDNEDIHSRVAYLLTHHLAPLGSSQGKKMFAHCYIRRGAKGTKTSLGELSIPEYNFGFMSLIDSPETFYHDKPPMFKHLATINEDASHYDWAGVRFWSEEVCALCGKMKIELTFSVSNTSNKNVSLPLLRTTLTQNTLVNAPLTHS